MTAKDRTIPKCIFTNVPLGNGTKPEHVLHNAFGGKKKTTRVICSDCNNAFGGGIDKSLTEQFEVIRNLLQMRSGTGKSAPMLRRLQAGSQVINALGDGTLELVIKPFTATKRLDGSFEVRINASSLEEIDKLVPHIAASIGMSEVNVRQQIMQGSATHVEQRPETVPFSLVFGGEEALRSAAKSLLVLWALLVGNEEVRGIEYGEARDFVMHGGEHFRLSRANLDSRFLDEVERLKEAYGPLFNLIYVRSDEYGRVIGHATFYNVIAFQIVLAENGGTPNCKIGLISNPLDTKVWTDKAGDLFDIPFDWLSSPDYEFNAAGQRVSNVMQTYVETSTPKEWARIINDVCDRYGMGENDPIPHALLPKIVSEISSRIGRHMFGVPFQETITSDELKKILGRNSPT